MCNPNDPILLVEDEPTDAILFRRALERNGIRQTPVIVSNGEEAIQYLQGSGGYADRQRHPMPSIIVLDIKMPRRSGFEVLDWIRSRPDALRNLPVVMLSSSALATDVTAALDKGANSYVSKPATTEEYTRMAAAFAAFWMNYHEQASCPRFVRQ
ncbi:MAG: response regulator [Acidobacteria bacterium]|nr:response regulator [Acidobacteriota bacterium]